MKIIGADERLAEKRGVKMLIVGPTGVGKTCLLRTLDPARTLFVDIEAGDLAVQDVPVDTVRVDDWPTARDLACRIGGPNPSFPPTACYSRGAFPSCRRRTRESRSLRAPSSSTASPLSVAFRSGTPSSSRRRSSARGAKDIRSAYGLHAREMLALAAPAAARAREDTSSSSASSKRSPTSSIAPNSRCRWKAPRPAASCPASSTRSSR